MAFCCNDATPSSIWRLSAAVVLFCDLQGSLITADLVHGACRTRPLPASSSERQFPLKAGSKNRRGGPSMNRLQQRASNKSPDQTLEVLAQATLPLDEFRNSKSLCRINTLNNSFVYQKSGFTISISVSTKPTKFKGLLELHWPKPGDDTQYKRCSRNLTPQPSTMF